MKLIVKTALIVLGAVLLAVLLRIFAIGSYAVTFAGLEPTLYKGERILVNKWDYGQVKRGDLIVFHDPSEKGSKILIGKVMAQPGDVIYMDHDFCFTTAVNLRDTLPAQPIMIPLKGVETPVRPWNSILLCNTLVLHEHKKAEVKDGELLVDEKPVTHWTFSKNYYWVMTDNDSLLTDSRSFGFVPEDCLIGKPMCIWFTHEWNRLWKKVE